MYSIYFKVPELNTWFLNSSIKYRTQRGAKAAITVLKRTADKGLLYGVFSIEEGAGAFPKSKREADIERSALKLEFTVLVEGGYYGNQ
jgi:hypothetical protein